MTAWSPGEIEKLRELMSRGLSFSNIAAILGRTKNACIGASHRMEDYVPHAKPVAPEPERKAVVVAFPAKRKPVSRVFGHQITRLRENECRWPIGQDADGQHLFCSKETEPGRSYCCAHRSLAYVRQTR